MNYSKAINSKPTVLVEFYASWCPHCHRMMPVVAQIKELLEGQVDVYQYDIDDNQQLADDRGVESVPTFIVYKDGEEEWRRTGEMPGDVLLANVQRYV